MTKTFCDGCGVEFGVGLGSGRPLPALTGERTSAAVAIRRDGRLYPHHVRALVATHRTTGDAT